jgi:endoglucanase
MRRHPHRFQAICLLLIVGECLGIPTVLFARERVPTPLKTKVHSYYRYWTGKYLMPSSRFPGDYKINYDAKGATVSEAIGYGMLITVLMGDEDPAAKKYFDGLDRFRKRFPSAINPSFMCWRIPASEHPKKDDCATDGELDIAYALLLAHKRWGGDNYLDEAKSLIGSIRSALVRPDFSLRLGDWNDAPGQTRPSDFMPVNFRAFHECTGDVLWTKVEERCYEILRQLQLGAAKQTGLVPDFSIQKGGHWIPAKAGFLEGAHDGAFSYNACRVPWRIGWAAMITEDTRAKDILARFMDWIIPTVKDPRQFRAGYALNGQPLHNSDFDSSCFISPTGVAARVVGKEEWEAAVVMRALGSREEYYEDSINLLCLLLLSGSAG